MTLTLLLIIALVQGLSEYLPVSSSAHLIFIPLLLGEEPQRVLIDVMAHLGSLLAVLIYFRNEVRTRPATMPMQAQVPSGLPS